MDRTRVGSTVFAVSSGQGTPSIVLNTTIPASAGAGIGYYQVGDVIQVNDSRTLGLVTAIGTYTNVTLFQQVTLLKIDPTGTNPNWSAATANTNFSLGHVFSAFAEGSTGPLGRVFLPYEDFNYTQIIRRAMKITGSEMSNRTLLGDGRSWYFTVEDILMKEFARDRELLVMFGQKSPSTAPYTTTTRTTRGILDWVLSSGIVNTYSSTPGVTEADLQNMIQTLLPEGGSAEYLVLCGSTFLSRVQVSLKDYAIHGIDYGALGKNMAGLDFQGYKFAGKTIYFAYYILFDDPQVLNYLSTPSATAINYRDFSLWLDLGTDAGGTRLIKLKYKANGMVQRKFVHKIIPGMIDFNGTGPDGGIAANSFDGVEVQLLSEIGVELRLPNRFGVLRANS
ncbi:MAG: DUF5309 family protein [Planctomycetota bacterium]|nr:DUF5309 family protein [Planctomycetota bacterium]